MNARRTGGAASRAASSAGHQKLETYASPSAPRASSAATRAPVSRARASLASLFSSTLTSMRPRQNSSTSPSVSEASSAGGSWEMMRRPSGASQTSVSTSSQPSASAFSNDAIVFPGACPDAPRCPIRRNALDEERCHVATSYAIVHLPVARARSAAVGGVEDLRQQVDVARRVEEEPGAREHEPHGEVDVALVGERLVPGRRARRSLARARAPRGALDRLQRDAAGLADRDQRLRAG